MSDTLRSVVTVDISWKFDRIWRSCRAAVILRAESLSIFVDKSGRGKKTLPVASTFRIEPQAPKLITRFYTLREASSDFTISAMGNESTQNKSGQHIWGRESLLREKGLQFFNLLNLIFNSFHHLTLLLHNSYALQNRVMSLGRLWLSMRYKFKTIRESVTRD